MACQKIPIAVEGSEYAVMAAKKYLELAHQHDAKTAFLFAIDTAKTLGNIDARITQEQALIVVNF